MYGQPDPMQGGFYQQPAVFYPQPMPIITPQPGPMQPGQMPPQRQQPPQPQNSPQNGSQQQGWYNSPPPAPSPSIGFKIVPVASPEEARAIPTDFMGNTMILLDFSHGRIYTKGIDAVTGEPTFSIYGQIEEPPAPPPYDARNDIATIREELEALKKELGISGGVSNEP